MRDYFSRRKADDEARLTPDEEDNAAAREIGRKDGVVFKLIGYKIAHAACVRPYALLRRCLRFPLEHFVELVPKF